MKSSFYESAKSLSRNPLGIIALFIALAYAVACIVISLAKPDFYQNPYHPAILFLALFPMVVLMVFAFLVACHHRKLYAPKDFRDEANFLVGHEVPRAVRGLHEGVATSGKGSEVDPSVASRLESAYGDLVEFGFVLVHQCETLRERTAPKSGRYRVRVWVESINPERSLLDIASVTYHVWHDFPSSVLSTTDRNSNFDLWMTVYGEFPVLAVVSTTEGKSFTLQRFIDLPGRPPD